MTGGIQWYGAASDRSARERAQSAQQAQVAIQLASAREKALSDLRAQMFNGLLQNYFKQASDPERIAILELIALNFRDAVQIRPMLELLDTQLQTGRSSEVNLGLRAELRRAARFVVRDQLEQIRGARDGGVSPLKLTVGESASPECFQQLSIRLLGVTDSAKIKVQANSANGKLLEAPKPQDKLDEFEVTYFDMPMVDYSTVRSATGQSVWRYSIVLHDVTPNEKSAEIVVACLPLNPVDAERRYAFDELLGQFLHPDNPDSP